MTNSSEIKPANQLQEKPNIPIEDVLGAFETITLMNPDYQRVIEEMYNFYEHENRLGARLDERDVFEMSCFTYNRLQDFGPRDRRRNSSRFSNQRDFINDYNFLNPSLNLNPQSP